ncbi:MAG: DUF983 domain-containing protein [Rhodospirillales bacterium]|nr:DUF983 domain-containing protein [Rhodospirillales bacterium]
MIDEPPHKTEYRPDIDKGGPDGFPVHSAAATIRFGVSGRCPRCGVGRLFTSYLKVTERCNVCGLGFAGHDVGDGPVVPAILVIGGIIVGLAWMMEVTFQPPLWVHAALWGPLTLGLSLGMLPLLKGLSVALQFRLRSTEEEPKPGGG